MSKINPVLNFEITSKTGLSTSRDIELKFLSYEERFKDNREEVTLFCLKEKVKPIKGSQSINAVDVIIGLAGNMAASYLYDLIKEFLVGQKEARKGKGKVEIETKHFVIKISSDNLSIDEVAELTKTLLQSK